jgi:hypothetical protein
LNRRIGLAKSPCPCVRVKLNILRCHLGGLECGKCTHNASEWPFGVCFGADLEGWSAENARIMHPNGHSGVGWAPILRAGYRKSMYTASELPFGVSQFRLRLALWCQLALAWPAVGIGAWGFEWLKPPGAPRLDTTTPLVVKGGFVFKYNFMTI